MGGATEQFNVGHAGSGFDGLPQYFTNQHSLHDSCFISYTTCLFTRTQTSVCFTVHEDMLTPFICKYDSQLCHFNIAWSKLIVY